MAKINEWMNERYLYKSILSVCKKEDSWKRWRQDGGSLDSGDQCLKWKWSGINIIVNKYKLDLHQRSRPRECRVFSKIKLKWMSVSQQGANHHQQNVKYGETILKMISAKKLMRYMNKSYLETEFIQITEWTRGQKIYLWHNKEDRVLEPRCHRV